MTGQMEELFQLQMDALKEVGNIGAGTAATSLSIMIRRPVTLKVPRVTMVSSVQVREVISTGGGIHIQVHGDAPGNLLLVIAPERASRLVDMLMGLPMGTTRAFGEMENSALSEVGNILAGNYMNALNQMTGLAFDLSIPRLVENLSEALSTQEAFQAFLSDNNYALVIETEFSEGDNQVIGDIVLLPDPGSLNIIFNKLGLVQLLRRQKEG